MIADICIIGDGYSSTILLLNLARKKFDLKKVIVVGPDQLGAGQAFAHHGFDYRLNGPADRIKILKDEPYDFLNWAEKNIVDHEAKTKIGKFYRRRDFSKYLTYKLEKLKNYSDIRQIKEVAVDIEFKNSSGQIFLSNGTKIKAKIIVMATGNPDSSWPFKLAIEKNQNLIEEPWRQTWARNISSHNVVALIGSGLTALDAIHELKHINFKGEILLISPKGLVPTSHIGWYRSKQIKWPKNLNAILFYKFMRHNLNSLGWNDPEWQRTFDGLREGISTAWIKLSPDDRKKLITKLGWLWQLMRFRASPQVSASMNEFLHEGRLKIVKNRATLLERKDEDTFLIKLEDNQSVTANFVINCTGARQNKLIKKLIDRKFIKADPAFPLHPKITKNLELETQNSQPFLRIFALGPPTAHFCGDVIGATKIANQAECLANVLGKIFKIHD